MPLKIEREKLLGGNKIVFHDFIYRDPFARRSKGIVNSYAVNVTDFVGSL